MSDTQTDGRAADVDQDVAQAVGLVTEALERIERARGRLYDFHQLIGRADEQLGEAAEKLRAAGCAEQADALEREAIGKDVLEGRWTFQVVEEFDDGYYRAVRTVEETIRTALTGGVRHVHEARLKAERQR